MKHVLHPHIIKLLSLCKVDFPVEVSAKFDIRRKKNTGYLSRHRSDIRGSL